MKEIAPLAIDSALQTIIKAALAEDVGTGDVTSLALVDERRRIEAHILARETCVVSGGTLAAAVFRTVDSGIACRSRLADGMRAQPGETVLEIKGPARGILTAERTALNFMQRLSGIATLTGRFVDAVRNTGVLILDTRKTTPGLRVLEKYAVRCGGGANHRMGLFDRVLIKDNHRRLWGGGDPLALDAAIREARRRFPSVPVEIEVENETELRTAMQASPDWILLDNMDPDALRRCVDMCGGCSRLEASGGITLESVAAVARSGVDAVSLGCLTHSAPAIDLSLEIDDAAPADPSA